mgnify:CR=1 FL=1
MNVNPFRVDLIYKKVFSFFSLNFFVWKKTTILAYIHTYIHTYTHIVNSILIVYSLFDQPRAIIPRNFWRAFVTRFPAASRLNAIFRWRRCETFGLWRLRRHLVGVALTRDEREPNSIGWRDEQHYRDTGPSRIPIPSDWRGARGLLPQEESRVAKNRSRRNPRDRPLQNRAMGPPR